MPRHSRNSLEQDGPGTTNSELDKASPASRLKAAMSRLGPSSPPERPAVAPSESDSDLNPAFSARKSLKDVFSRAMRGNQDSPGSQSASLNPVHNDEDSQLSDSSLPLSSQAASLQLLRQRLEIPEMSSRMDASRSTAKPLHSNQDLHRLLQSAEAQEAEDTSLDTARAASPPNQSMNDPEPPSARSERVYTPVRWPSNPTRTRSRTPSPSGGNANLPHVPSSDADTDASFILSAAKTPKPPGGWFTPSRGKGNTTTLDSPSNSTFTQTPAPPGAWKGTPMPSQARKGILKNAAHGEYDGMPSVSESEDVDPVSARAVTLVDSFGRERKFDENGDEMGLSPTHDLQETQRQGASVRLVDSMGNELDPASLASQDASSDLAEYDNASLVARIGGGVVNLKQGLETAETRHESIRIRRIAKQASIPHERILQLAMDSRAARIERERLLRQSHLVRAREEEQSAQLAKLHARPLLTPQTTDSAPPAVQLNKGFITLMLLLPLLLLTLLYICARAYIRHYFLTSYYDPFFATVDPASLHRIPFLRLIRIPRRWDLFNVQHVGRALLGQLSGVGEVNKHLMTLISKPLADLDIKLPS